MTPDNELLRRYARTRSEEAFAELVRRHTNLVYSAALRQVGGDAHLARDTAQMVFTDLAQKASSLACRESLTGWLYTSAHFAAAKIAWTEDRRRNREEKFMREPATETVPETDWEKIHPALDDAMHELKESDREAILFRYFENQPFSQVGARLGLNENAARMRVERALGKLRVIFAKRGITTAAVLASVISANAVQTAPSGLVAALTASSAAAAGTGSILTLPKLMTATCLKIGVSTLVVAGAAAVVVVQHETQSRLHNENTLLRQQITQLKTGNQGLSNRLAALSQSISLTADQLNELLRLRGEVSIFRQQTNKLRKLREKLNNLRESLQSSAGNTSPEEQQRQMARYKMSDAKYAAVSLRMCADDNNDLFPTNFDQVARYLNPTNLVQATNLAQVYSNEFEIVYRGSLTNFAHPDSAIVVQERQAWPTYNGKWAKVYGFADGHSEVIPEPDDNFTNFEQRHSALPIQNQ